MASVAATLVDRIDRQLLDLREDRDRLRAARSALVGTAAPVASAGRAAPAAPVAAPEAPSPPAPPRPAPRRRERPADAPSFDVVPVGKLLALLRGAAELTTKELAASTNGDPAQIDELLAEQESAGELRHLGSGDGARWRLLTDEDRIAARVADLESRGS